MAETGNGYSAQPTEFEPQSFNASESTQPFEYHLLRGHFRTDKTFKNDDQLRSEYVQLTDEIIRQLTEGVDIYNSDTKEYVKQKPDVVVWLDKSARPVSWLTKELWPTLAADTDGNVPKMPDFKFVNIDREQWVNTIDPGGSGYMDVGMINPTIIRSLRSIFVDPITKKDGLTEEIDKSKTLLDGKTVLIVDEVMSTGRTLDIATKFFARAFPDTNFASTHWMRGITQLKDSRGYAIAQGNADLPVWYKEADIRGRGVGNRDERISQQSRSLTQKLGSWFLSTRLPETDEASTQLRSEIKQLAADTARNEVLVMPSQGRDIDDIVERAKRLNGNIDFDTFREKKRELFPPKSSRLLP